MARKRTYTAVLYHAQKEHRVGGLTMKDAKAAVDGWIEGTNGDGVGRIQKDEPDAEATDGQP